MEWLASKYVCVWCWCVCASADASEESEEDEPTVEHVGIEVVYEWEHLSHVLADELPHTLTVLTSLTTYTIWWW